MAIQQMLGGMWFPANLATASATPGFVAKIMDSTGEKIGYVIPAPKTGTLDGFEVKLTTTTQTAVNGLRFSFQNRDASNGDPSGTELAFRTVTSGITSGAWLTTGSITSDGTDGGTKVSVTRGQFICCVIAWASFNSGNSVRTDCFSTLMAMRNIYSEQFASSWAKGTIDAPLIALRYDDGTYPMIRGSVFPIASIDTHSLGSNTTPDEVGMTFSFPAPVLIGGAYIRGDFPADIDVCLYDSQNNLLHSESFDKDCKVSSGGGTIEIYFSEDVPIVANETYRLTVKPTTSTTVAVYGYTVNAAAMLELQEGGAPWQLTTRVDAGAFTETSTKRPWMGVLVTGIDHEIGGQPSVGFEGTA